jgi:RNA polymerase sigma-70 factor (ECF subfamily)
MSIFSGTPEEFAKLYLKYKPAVYGTLYAHIPYNREIDDLAQETFLALYLSYGSVRDKAKIGAWLCGTARNLALKHLRSERFCLSYEELENAAGSGFEDGVIDREEIRALRRAIGSLPKPVAETMTLYYFAGRSVREISALLSVPEGTVKFRLHDGRNKLKGMAEIMEKQGRIAVNRDISGKIKSLINKARLAGDRHENAAVLASCDEAISMLGKAESDYKTLAEVYRLRAFADNRDGAFLDGEKSVACARLSGDRRLLCECLLSHSFNYNPNAVNQMAAPQTEAYRIGVEIGYHEICCECAYWLGTSSVESFDYAAARQWFKIALGHFEHIGTAGVNCCPGDTKRIFAMAKSALYSMDLLEAARSPNGEYISLNTLCQIFYTGGNTVATGNNYGWDIPGKQRGDGILFGLFERSQVVVSEDFNFCRGFTHEYYGSNGILIRRTYDIVSPDEIICVPAGQFKCLHTHITEEIPDTIEKSPERDAVYQWLCEADMWFCENIGLIKTRCSYPNAPHTPRTPAEARLSSFKANPSELPSQKYLPLVRGNQWEYLYFEKDGTPVSEKYDYHDIYEVALISDETAYLSNAGYSRLK